MRHVWPIEESGPSEPVGALCWKKMRITSQNPYVGMTAGDLCAALGKTVASTLENRFNPEAVMHHMLAARKCVAALHLLHEELLHGGNKKNIMVAYLTTSLVMVLEHDATIDTIKANIQKEEGVPAKFQRLVDDLGDEVTDMSQVFNGAVLHMVLTNHKKINSLPKDMDLDDAIVLCDAAKVFFGRNPEAAVMKLDGEPYVNRAGVVLELPVNLYVALREYLQLPMETGGAAAETAARSVDEGVGAIPTGELGRAGAEDGAAFYDRQAYCDRMSCADEPCG